MSLSHILQQFDSLGPQGPRARIVIDQGFTGSAELSSMFRDSLHTESVVLDAVTGLTSRADDHLQLTGTVTLLDMADVQATFLARESEGELLVTLELQLPSGWSFSKVLPLLPEHFAGEGALDEDKAYAPNFLTQLSLGAGRLIFSNRAFHDETRACELVPGLNFAGELYLGGVLLSLGQVLGLDKPVPLSGPLSEYRSTADSTKFLGVRLSAPVPVAASRLGPLTVRDSQLYLKSGVNDSDRDLVVSATQEPGIYLLAACELGGRPLQMVGQYEFLRGSTRFSLLGTFKDFQVSGFSSLSQNLGVDGLGDTLPEDLPVPKGLSVTELGLFLDIQGYDLLGLSVGVGMAVDWDLIPGVMALKEVSSTFAVRQPLGPQRSIQTTLTGLLSFEKFSLAAFAEAPDYRLGAGLPAGETLPLGDVLESLLPGLELPPLTLTNLLVAAEPKDKSLTLNATLEELFSLPVGATTFEMNGLRLAMQYDKRAGGASGTLVAGMSISDASVVLSAKLDKALTFSGSIENFQFKKFWSDVTNGEALPDEIPDLAFETLAVSVSPKTGDFSLRGSTTIAWDHLSGGTPLSTQVELSFARRGGALGSAFTANLSFQGSGNIEVAPGLALERFNLLFDYQTQMGWKLSGGVNVDLFDTKLALSAGYETSQAGKKLKLQAMASPPLKVIDLGGVGSYSYSQFDLLLERRATGGQAKTFFDLRLASTLVLELGTDNSFKLGGYLGLSDTAEGRKALTFKPLPGTTAWHVDFPTGQGMGVKGELFEVGFVKESASAGWSFTGTTQLGFTGFPGGLGDMLPSKVTAKLVAGKTDVRISALNVSDPIELALPTVKGKSLGKATVQLTELGVSLKPEPGLVLEAGLGLPAELNTYLGSQLFRVYQKGNPASMARTRFTISGTGVAVQFVSSPFAAANAVTVSGESWFDVDLGQYGALRLKMPTFRYDGVSQYFEAGGGCEITRPLALPLAPLKLFLEACGGKAMSDVFPDKLPIDGLSLVDKNGDLKIDELVTFLKKAGDVPGEVVSALKKTDKVLNRLPDGFKSYLRLEIPGHLEFKFGFSPAGRISLALLAPEKPVRVLFPSVVASYVPMPGLTGIELRKISVGTLMTGALFFGEVDALIDQFDLPSLALSLLLPTDPDFPLPTSNQLQRRIILDDVFCIIPVSQGLPIPVPVFYDELGFEYLGIEGLGLQAHVGFPKPPLDGAAAMGLFKAFDSFFSDREALLDPKKAPGGVDLGFVFHDEFLQAPEYLGGGLLGTRGKTVKVGSWKYVASMMNFGKTFSLNDCIGAIPLENRVGSAQYTFAFLKFDADWMLTTPAEFKAGSFQQLKLSASDCADFMTVLPTVASTTGQAQKGNEEGLVAFVRGKADLEFAHLDAAFGLAASGSMGFNTGFKLNGGFGNTEIELSGAVMVNAPLATNTAAAPATPTAAPKASQGGKALSFNGKDTWIEIPAADTLVLPEYTVELWLKSSREQSSEWIDLFGVDTRQGGGLWRNHFLALNAKDTFYHHRFTDASGGNAGAPNTPNGSVQWGRWQHVTLTNDGVTAKTYVDGKEVASGPVNGKLVLFKQPLVIGKTIGIPGGQFWKGELAEVRIWKHARSGADIQARMREVLQGDEKDLVSLYRFDEDTGQRAIDVCGRNHGTLRNGTFVDSDLLMLEGLEFDGKDDYIEVPDSQSLRLGAYTAEVWFKPYKSAQDLAIEAQAAVMAEAQAAQAAALKSLGIKAPMPMPAPMPVKTTQPEWSGVFGKKGRNYALFINKAGYAHHRFHSGAGTNDGAPNTPNGSIAWNQWNHVAITNDGKVARTYVNGVKLAEGPVTGSLVIDNEAISMGRGPDGGNGEPFAGEISELRLWSRARSPEELFGNMYRRLDGKDASLVSLWRFSEAEGDTLVDACGRNPGRIHMDHTAGAQLVDLGPNKLHGVTRGGTWALAAAPSEPARAAIQIQGHTHLAVAGRKVMQGDLRLVDDQFWFSGQLDLFPSDWPLRVRGHVEGMVSKQRFYLSGETENALFGLKLSQSRLFLSNEQLRLEGRWLGAYLMLDVSWEKNDPVFAGSVGFSASRTLQFGAIRIGGVKVADNYRLSLDIAADVSVKVSRQGLAGDVTARFKINGKGFDLHMGFDVAPSDLEQLFHWIQQKIIDAPEKYLAHLFADAVTWLKNVGEGVIEFAKDSGEAVGAALNTAFKVTKEAAVFLMKNARYAAEQVGAALNKAYNVAAKEAAQLLTGAQYTVEQVGAALSQGYNLAAKDAAAVLKDAGYLAEDVGKALQSAYKTSAETASSLMRQVGYGAEDVGKAMASAFNKTGKEIEGLLNSAGFSSKDVKGAMNKVGDWGKGAVNTLGNAGKSVGKALGF